MPEIDKKDQERAVKEYLFYMLQRYNFPNRRLILDASVDRIYIKLFPYFEKHKIPFMVIRLDVPREIIVERIMQREGKSARYYLNMLDKWFESYEEFGNNYKNYFLFKNVPGASPDAITDEIEHRLNAQIQE
jgi:thymidylate kinase